jgi:hypothetical protein
MKGCVKAVKINHVTGLDCPCKPQMFVLCDECLGDNPTCWKCGGEGLVETDRFHIEESPFPGIVLHKDKPEFYPLEEVSVDNVVKALREAIREQRGY